VLSKGEQALPQPIVGVNEVLALLHQRLKHVQLMQMSEQEEDQDSRPCFDICYFIVVRIGYQNVPSKSN
jgi:hypothetical protein